MKFCLRKALSIAAAFSFLMLAACSEPPVEEGSFTISLGANENTRAVYPPANTDDLKFTVKFKNTANGTEKTFSWEKSGSINGKIDVGNYIVTMEVSLISDDSTYARGVAFDNPVAIGSGQNPIKVYVYDVNKAAPPVISEKPHLLYEIVGGHTINLPITASVGDGGALSYQWFSNATDSNSGGTPVSTSQSFSSSSIWGGTAYYYAEITNTAAAGPSSIKTRPVKVSVSNGKGTVDDPFLVYDVASLEKVGSETDGWTLDVHYRQTTVIDLASVPNWIPIGSQHTGSFTGIYDGSAKTISNLTINAPTEDEQGLFGFIEGSAVVKNVGLVNCTIVGNDRVGGVVGFNHGMVQNCYATGNVSGNSMVGGVVGWVGGNGLTDCYATASVSGIDDVGGVVGANNATVQYCYSTGNVSGSYMVGGVIGYGYKVQYCYSTGSVSGETYVGGVVGNANNTVQNCYSTGSVSGEFYVGGVAAYSDGLQYCYATGNVSGDDDFEVGGVVGTNSKVQNCVALNSDISDTGGGTKVGRVGWFIASFAANNYGRDDMKKNGGATTWVNVGLNDRDGESITSADWGSQSWWTDPGNWDTAAWDFTDVWEWGSSLPILRNMPSTATQNPVVLP
jgi:hypothetical protein